MPKIVKESVKAACRLIGKISLQLALASVPDGLMHGQGVNRVKGTLRIALALSVQGSWTTSIFSPSGVIE